MRAITSSHPCLSSFNYSRVVYKKFVRAYSTQSLFTCLDSNSRFESRSSRSEVFCKNGVLKNFAKFTGKKLCQNLFFNNDAGPRSNASGGCCCHFKQFKKFFFKQKNSVLNPQMQCWRGLVKDFNSLMHNVPKWSEIL